MRATIANHKPSFSELPDWCSPEEVRIFLGLGRATVYELIRSKKISARRFGRRIRVPKDSLRPSAQELAGV